jgi:hypothetical protein
VGEGGALLLMRRPAVGLGTVCGGGAAALGLERRLLLPDGRRMVVGGDGVLMTTAAKLLTIPAVEGEVVVEGLVEGLVVAVVAVGGPELIGWEIEEEEEGTVISMLELTVLVISIAGTSFAIFLLGLISGAFLYVLPVVVLSVFCKLLLMGVVVLVVALIEVGAERIGGGGAEVLLVLLSFPTFMEEKLRVNPREVGTSKVGLVEGLGDFFALGLGNMTYVGMGIGADSF